MPIQRVLGGKASYDELCERDQAVVRAIWDEQMDARRAHLDLAAEFTRTGQWWTEADESGRALVRNQGV